MNSKAHYNPKSLKWVISIAVMFVLTAGIIFGTAAIEKAHAENSSKPVDVGFTISSTAPFAVEANDYNVTGVEKAFDSNGNHVAYVVTLDTVGYNQEVPIKMQATVTKDAGVVCGIDIISQKETEYLGVRIQEDGFKNQFTNKKLPVKNSSGIAKGSGVDIIARSTVSSQAVIDGVNNAMHYVETYLS